MGLQITTEQQAMLPHHNAFPRPAYAWYVVAVLTLAAISAYIDRLILSLLVTPIKRDFILSDTEMSLLMGFSFALFYTLLGLPMGRWADSHSRKRIIMLGIILWSVMTALSGIAKNYGHLFLARVGVGVGEAALFPAAYSMIADYFPKPRLALAMSVFGMGIFIGAGLAMFINGLIVGLTAQATPLELPVVGTIFPWQKIFFVIGLPGLLVAALLLTVREPVRHGGLAGTTGVERTQYPMRAVLAYMRANKRTFLCHHLGFALFALHNYAANAWIPPFFMRTYGWEAAKVGTVYGPVIVVFGTLGILLGGYFTDWLARRGHVDAKLRTGLTAALALTPAIILYPLMPNGEAALLALIPVNIFASFAFGAATAAIQEVTPNQMRAQVSALYLFVINLIGLGLGPTAVALITDFVFGDENCVRYSLIVVGTLALLPAALLFWLGLKPYRRSLANLQEQAAARH
ncbi:MAG: MFS transporter [candidate division KSB1 bacterium]|nr:MFS transporter [candidate division KSB1 bacterium]MDZ7276083.1 MFS transporter [candidate division KSB1 bacterium]MDZ7296938.1 MFS transporter [candidate division KSB1 bacterium]MDZ7347805.1 MFS transporter [candidate division KSB1 bacterium]MDZ7352110.1 MFS transporter [candidate division KSB1 bacterium]